MPHRLDRATAGERLSTRSESSAMRQLRELTPQVAKAREQYEELLTTRQRLIMEVLDEGLTQAEVGVLSGMGVDNVYRIARNARAGRAPSIGRAG